MVSGAFGAPASDPTTVDDRWCGLRTAIVAAVHLVAHLVRQPTPSRNGLPPQQFHGPALCGSESCPR